MQHLLPPTAPSAVAGALLMDSSHQPCCTALHLQEEEAEPLNRREQQRADRAEAREAEAAAREARQAKINAYDDKRRKKEEEREAREKAQVGEMQHRRQAIHCMCSHKQQDCLIDSSFKASWGVFQQVGCSIRGSNRLTGQQAR